ncbi:Negative elongation factor B [Gigaspora margarita]|uniref:Negative elongation factor B n=1 Tax=Gigaspora margarita TaxID=4874 RepID=A0A8H3WW77_GIGMA|nr:Negative elongation factor B [Gigaspora margarita]
MADPNTTETPLAAALVQAFQEQNQVNVENIENVYPLLDISGVSRYDTHHHMLEELKNNFIQAIITQHWDQEKFTRFLSMIMPQISFKEFRDIIFEALKKYPDRITEEIYEQLAREPTVIHEAPIEIKRGLYERDQEMFKEMIKTQIDNYFKRQSLIMQQRGTDSDILDQRTNIPELKYIIDLVNESSILFREMQDIIIEIYKDNGHSNICSFRFDFFNCMQKAGKISMCMKDHSYNVIWLINEGIIKGLNEARISDIQTEFQKYTRNFREFAEIAMVFQDPIVYNFLSARILEVIKECMFEYFNDTNRTVLEISIHGTVEAASTDLIKKPILKWLSKMVTLGGKSHEMLLLSNASMPVVDEKIYSKFYNKLLYWVYEDLERAQTARIVHQEILEDEETVSDLCLVHKFDTAIIYSSIIEVFGQYLLDRCQNNDVIALLRALSSEIEILKKIDPIIYNLFIKELIDSHSFRILYSKRWQHMIDGLVKVDFYPLINLFSHFYGETVTNFLLEKGDIEKLRLVKNWSEKAASTIKETPSYADLVEKSANVISGLYKIE